MTYRTEGTCARSIDFEVEDGVVTSCRFSGGCPGNAEAVSRLVVGRRAEEAAALLEGIDCQNGTSCPDQLSRALSQYLQGSRRG